MLEWALVYRYLEKYSQQLATFLSNFIAIKGKEEKTI